MLSVNSNYATNKEDRRSVSRYLHIVGGTIMSWMSKTQLTVALLSCEAEYISLTSNALCGSWDFVVGGQHGSNIIT